MHLLCEHQQWERVRALTVATSKELIQMGLVHTESDGAGKGADDKEVDTASSRRRARVEPAPPAEQAVTGGLTRITANFTPRAMQALERLSDKTGDSKTDILNRAVMVLEVVVEALDKGDGKVRVVNPDGTQEVWRLMG
jgi:hypothetical protein